MRTKNFQTMYIGGGTPTSLKEEDLEYLLYEVNKRFPFSKIQEITVEAGRPDSLNFEKLKILKKYGVTRISINPQSRTIDIKTHWKKSFCTRYQREI